MDTQIPDIYNLSQFNKTSKPLICIKFYSFENNILTLLVNDTMYSIYCYNKKNIEQIDFTNDMSYKYDDLYGASQILININSIIDNFKQESEFIIYSQNNITYEGLINKLYRGENSYTHFSNGIIANFKYIPNKKNKILLSYNILLQKLFRIIIDKPSASLLKSKMKGYVYELKTCDICVSSGVKYMKYYLYYIDIIKCGVVKKEDQDELLSINDSICREKYIKDIVIKSDEYIIMMKLMKRENAPFDISSKAHENTIQYYRLYINKIYNKTTDSFIRMNIFKDNKHHKYNTNFDKIDLDSTVHGMIDIPFDIYNGAFVICNYSLLYV